MSYLGLFSSHHIALLSDWLGSSGELYVDIYLPRSGASSSAYLIHSIAELKELIARQTHTETDITIFRSLQFPLRGIADAALLEKALSLISDGEYYSIIALEESVFPSSIDWQGEGRSHVEVKRDFAELDGESIGIGQEPVWVHSPDWIESHPDEAFHISMNRTTNFSVLANQSEYPPFQSHPENYKQVLDYWQQQ